MTLNTESMNLLDGFQYGFGSTWSVMSGLLSLFTKRPHPAYSRLMSSKVTHHKSPWRSELRITFYCLYRHLAAYLTLNSGCFHLYRVRPIISNMHFTNIHIIWWNGNLLHQFICLVCADCFCIVMWSSVYEPGVNNKLLYCSLVKPLYRISRCMSCLILMKWDRKTKFNPAILQHYSKAESKPFHLGFSRSLWKWNWFESPVF